VAARPRQARHHGPLHPRRQHHDPHRDQPARLINLILQIPGFTDATAVKTYCSVFPFLGPPLQLSGTAPFKIIPQTCP
jgi:hypothetical protein